MTERPAASRRAPAPCGHAVRVGALAWVMSGALACQPAAAPVREAAQCSPPEVHMTVIASRNVNPDDDGQPRPVQVRLYQLKTDSRILNASFDDIWKAEKATLKDDLVSVDEFPAYPDTRSEGKFQLSADARFLAAVALFRNPHGRSFWTEFELPVSTKEHCAPSPLAFAVYVDQTRLTEGSDHLDDNPDRTRVRELPVHFDSSSGSSDKADDGSGRDRGRQP